MKKYLSFLVFTAATICFASCEKVPGPNGGNNGQPVEETRLQKKSSKKGVAFNFNTIPQIDFPLLGPAISWSYNWGMEVSDNVNLGFKEYALDYCPMVWNADWKVENLAKVAEKTSAKYLLAFNEPNLTDQANLTPAEAASHWPAVLEAAKANNLKIIAPAMNYGTLDGYNDPFKWLDEFFEQDGVSIDDVDGIAIHCYMPSSNSLKKYISEFKKYGKSIWLTEFCAWDRPVSVAEQKQYMVEAINYLESDPDVFRYAWFIPRGNGESECHNSLLTPIRPSNLIELTPLGKIFTNMSTWDKDLWYSPSDVIPAEHYNSCSGDLHLELTSDNGGELDLTDLASGVAVNYQLEIDETATYSLDLRFNTYYETALKVIVDGKDCGEIKFENTKRKWSNFAFEGLALEKGRHTLTLEGASDFPVTLNYLIIKK